MHTHFAQWGPEALPGHLDARRFLFADRLVAKGYGQTTPVADNRTQEGRVKNRRVELVKK